MENGKDSYVNIRPFARGICACGFISEVQEPMRVCHCGLVHSQCAIFSRHDLTYYCIRCYQHICTKDEAKLLLAIVAGVSNSLIPKLCNVKPDSARAILEELKERGLVEEKDVAWTRRVKPTDIGLAICITSLSAYSPRDEIFQKLAMELGNKIAAR